MDDLEMTKMCAEAMGYRDAGLPASEPAVRVQVCHEVFAFDPLHNDAQAMALVKKFCLSISADWTGEHPDSESAIWWVTGDTRQVADGNLNLAIVECVAKMQAAKTPAPPLP